MTRRNICCQSGSVLFLLMSLLGFIVSFSSTYWLVDADKHYGLWKLCTGDFCASLVGKQLSTASYTSARILFCVALVLCAVSVGGHIAWMVLEKELTAVIAWLTELSAAFCAGVAVILFGNETFRYFGNNLLSWSYWLMISSITLMALSAGITACKTGCGTRLERRRTVIYSSTAAARGAAGAGTAFLSQSSETLNYSDNESNVASPSRAHRGWREGNYKY